MKNILDLASNKKPNNLSDFKCLAPFMNPGQQAFVNIPAKLAQYNQTAFKHLQSVPLSNFYQQDVLAFINSQLHK